ncbi:PC4 domain-containing protein [Nephila pilipes]|uniref:PC4 domain-containing protein n=1 Tax=Nephila pilipes TaxID=299642 RepID=A0A8X6PND8_NEPPI|nr:PC4 domain-containing protein [Nephila pilipes]
MIMKRFAPLASTNDSVKKVCFNKDRKNDSSFKQEAVPKNHFHLGRSNYAIVSDFANVARIHLRQYKLIDQAFHDGKVFVVKDCLILSRTVIENVTYLT